MKPTDIQILNLPINPAKVQANHTKESPFLKNVSTTTAVHTLPLDAIKEN
jgi:hypothetical protein